MEVMNIRVLIYLNPLVFNKISKKFLAEKDSGILYTKQLIESLPTNWRFTILVPKGVTANFFGNTHIIECIEYDYSTSIHKNRYHFNQTILSKSFPFTKDVDVIINNQPEVASNLKVFFKIQRREHPIIINLFHWIDCKESSKFADDLSGFIFRQVEGFNEADINLFHNEYALRLFRESADENSLPIGKKQTGFFHPQPTDFGVEPINLPNKKIVLFNHRLNNTTGWKEVLKICEKIREERDDFVLWITDENRDEVSYKVERDWLITKSIPFQSYGYLLRNSLFSICNVKRYATWNMSMLDSLHYGTPVLAQNTPLMKQLGADTTEDLESSISKYIDNSKKPISWDEIKISNDFDYSTWIYKTILYRIENKNPKKYDQVSEYITISTPKRDFVNHFWQYHANSNFQKIRWKLLADGFIDDTNNSDTVYSEPNTDFSVKAKLEQKTLL